MTAVGYDVWVAFWRQTQRDGDTTVHLEVMRTPWHQNWVDTLKGFDAHDWVEAERWAQAFASDHPFHHYVDRRQAEAA